MKCPNCGAINKHNYCIKCGTMIMSDGTIGKINIEEKKTIYDELEIFIGNNAEQIIHKGFNYAAGFLTPIYLLYRKCITEGILLLLIDSFIIALYFVIVNGPLFAIPFSIQLGTILSLYFLRILIFGSTFNSYYLHRCKSIINKLTLQSNNKTELFQKYGGVSLVWPIVIPIIFIVVILICMFSGIRIM